MKKKVDKFEELVACFEKLPGVGKKSALRYAYFVSIQDSFLGLNLAHSIEDAVHFLKKCQICGAICENEICDVCADEERDKSKICIVENPKDILIFENSSIFDGLYFVLDDINMQNIQKLKSMIEQNGSIEIIFAMTPGINSDGIMLYIEDKLKDLDIKFSKIAQGIPTGVSIENVDMLSLTKALKDRIEA